MFADPPIHSTVSVHLDTSNKSSHWASYGRLTLPIHSVRKLVADHFTKPGAKVREQPFEAVHPMTGKVW